MIDDYKVDRGVASGIWHILQIQSYIFSVFHHATNYTKKVDLYRSECIQNSQDDVHVVSTCSDGHIVDARECKSK